MENNKIFYNKNFGSVNMYNEKLLVIDKNYYNDIYDILIKINNILELQKFCYERYLKNSNNNLEKITPELLNEKSQLIKDVYELYVNINKELHKNIDNFEKIEERSKTIQNKELKEKFLSRIENDYKKIIYTRDYTDKLNEIYNKIDIKDIYVKKLNQECRSKFWMDYFILSENNISNKEKIKEGNKKKNSKKIEIVNNTQNNNSNNNLENTKVINNKIISNKNIVTNNILNFFDKKYLIKIRYKEINTSIFPQEFNNILSEQNKNRFKNIKIIANGRKSGLYIEIQHKNGKEYSPYGHMSFHFLENWSKSPIHLKANSNKSKNNIGTPIDCLLKKTNYGIIIINRKKYINNSVMIFIIDLCILSLNQLYNEYKSTL
jgi:hypothetical protein